MGRQPLPLALPRTRDDGVSAFAWRVRPPLEDAQFEDVRIKATGTVAWGESFRWRGGPLVALQRTRQRGFHPVLRRPMRFVRHD